MKITYLWLKEYLDTDKSPEEIVEILTDLGLEVESLTSTLPPLKQVVVGKVLSIQKHPKADRLQVCKVDAGQESELTIICGAPNVCQGASVAVALDGAILPMGKVETREVRGIRSEGMLCSQAELEIGEDAEGIWILDDGFTMGQNLRSCLKEDAIIELSLGPNRPDCLGLFGILRELAIKLELELEYPNPRSTKLGLQEFCVEIKDTQACPRYVGALVKNISVGPSPDWLKNRLHHLGLRSINNIVDLTNCLMLEFGHPMHAFDADQLDGNKIIVRFARPGETLVTLDDIKRDFSTEDPVICDESGPVAIAGIMGGKTTQVSPTTCNIFLEVGYFDPIIIRKSAKRLKLHTDASHRFERGMDPEMPPKLALYAIDQILNLAGGEYQGLLDLYPKPKQRPEIIFKTSLSERILGIQLSPDWSEECLSRLGCQITRDSEDCLRVTPPSFRPDLERPIDLVEELARIYGLNKIPFEPPKVALNYQKDHLVESAVHKLKSELCGLGLQECITYSFAEKSSVPSIKLVNPMAEDMQELRTCISQNLLKVAVQNCSQRNHRLGLFETGTVFLGRPSANSDLTHKEELHLGVLTGGLQETNWKNKSKMADFFEMKGVLAGLEEAFRFKLDLRHGDCNEPKWDSDQFREIYFGETRLGFIAMVNSRYLKKRKIHFPLAIMEIKLEPILGAKPNELTFQEIPQFPSADKQLALITPRDLPASEVLEAISALKLPTLENHYIFDLYKGKEIHSDSKSLGIHFVFRGENKTLSENEMGDSIRKILNCLHQKYQIVLRP
jgi:phenylalanyl-tRNA synthetase beta chain